MFEKIKINPNEKISLQIYREIKKAIIYCTLPQGHLLSEKEIAERFNVSRQPVREAFIKLADVGLLHILPQRGSFVTQIQPQQVIDAQFIREAIELAIIARVTTEITDQYLIKLEANLKEQALAIKENNPIVFLEKDDEFHQLLIASINCPIAWDIIENIKVMMDRVRFLTLQHITPPQLMFKQHTAIVEALKSRDEAMALTCMKDHLRTILSSMNDIFDQYQEHFN